MRMQCAHVHTHTHTCVHAHTHACTHTHTHRHIHTHSDAHFHQSLVVDRLKSQKTNCFNLHQDLGLIKMQFWWSCVPFIYLFIIFFNDAADKPFVFPPNSSLRFKQKTGALTSLSRPQGHHK